MRDGAPLIYQAQLFDGLWQGRADFLRKVSCPSTFGDFAYEVLDTKLARGLKPPVVHQLSLYNRLVGQIQGVEATLPTSCWATGRLRRLTCGATRHSIVASLVDSRSSWESRDSRRILSPSLTAGSVRLPTSATHGGSYEQMRGRAVNVRAARPHRPR